MMRNAHPNRIKTPFYTVLANTELNRQHAFDICRSR